jgi:ADP-ribosylglycohydrolase
MMLGLAIGDSLGNTSEGRNPGERAASFGEIRDYRPNRHAYGRPVGLPSDDTQLAFWTLEQINRDGSFSPDKCADLFASRPIFGIGRAVSEFVCNRRMGKPWQDCGARSAGNGALMRIAPIVIPHLARPAVTLWKDAASAACITHNDAGSTGACVAFTAILWDLLRVTEVPAPQWWLDRYVEVAKGVEGESCYRPRGGDFIEFAGPIWRFVDTAVRNTLLTGVAAKHACDSWYSGAFLLETVPSALYILASHASDPEEAIVRAVNDTRDNDTVGAIVGACVGALHGARSLPRRWREGLLGRTGESDDGHVFALLAMARQKFGGVAGIHSAR